MSAKADFHVSLWLDVIQNWSIGFMCGIRQSMKSLFADF
jgi:hypothetical protein